MDHIIILYNSIWFLKNEGTFFKRIELVLNFLFVLLYWNIYQYSHSSALEGGHCVVLGAGPGMINKWGTTK